MKICSLYGAGFYYIPGTDTCLKVGGWVRQEIGYGNNGSFTTPMFNNYLNTRATVGNNWRVKGVITFDAREQTEYGTLRSYAALGISTNNTGQNPPATADNAYYVPRWFIQWAGFTMGHASSFYDFYNTGANQYNSLTGAGPDSTDGGWDVFGYTAQFGNGVSASIAAEVSRRTTIRNVAGNVAATGFQLTNPFAGAAAANAGVINTGTTLAGQGYAGQQWPDLVANLRVDQAWGSAQIQGALHNVNASYNGVAEGTGHVGDKVGGAIGGGVKFLTPFIAKGDYFEMGADYAVGATRYLMHGLGGANTFTYYDGANVAIGTVSDAVVGGTVAGGNNTMELTRGWDINAAFTHFWLPNLKSTLWANYVAINYNAGANAMLCSSIGFGNGLSGTLAVANAGCDFDWSAWAVGLRTEWAATKNLSLGIEVLYGQMQSMSVAGNVVTIAANGAKPTAAYTLSDQDQVAVRFRATRNFYP